MRIKPTALIGIGIWLLYGAIVVIIQKTSGIPYTEFGDSAANMWRAPVLSLVVGAVVLAVLAIWMGWWRAALTDRHRVRIGWTLIAPALILVMIVGFLVNTDWGNLDTSFLVAAIALGVLVGFAEEFQCRGLLLVGLRGSMREVGVWALTCVLFGVMHGAAILLGQSVGSTVQQVLLAGAQGSAFYILRRFFGSLVLAMALHGLWDFSLFVQDSSGVDPSLISILEWPALILAIIGGFVVARRTERDGQVEDYAVGATPVAATATP